MNDEIVNNIDYISLDGEPLSRVLIADPKGGRVFVYKEGWREGEVRVHWLFGYENAAYEADPFPIVSLPPRVSFRQMVITLAKVSNGIAPGHEAWDDSDEDAVFMSTMGESLYKIPEAEAVLELPQRGSPES